MSLKSTLPILDWGARYRREEALNDAVAAAIVTVMLIPQSLAYAMLAGLPAEVGLYASIAPLVLYGVFGTSRTLSVGPVAVISLMTAAAVGQVAAPGSAEAVAAALVLALMSGLMLMAMGLLRLGMLSSFISHPVISGFITASGLLIAASQLRHLLGVEASGQTLLTLGASLMQALPEVNPATLAVGLPALAFLIWVRGGLQPLLMRAGLGARAAALLARTGPVIAVAVATTATWALDLQAHGVAIVGAVPQGLPPMTWPGFDAQMWSALSVSALLIAVVGFVESVSVAQTLAARRRQRIDPDQELIGLGAANISAGLTGGYPVTGGFARSVVNFDAGAATPAAGMLTAAAIAAVALTLTPLLTYLPNAVLAATIIVAVTALIDPGALLRVWAYDRADGAAQAATIAVTLTVGVEAGILAGVALSIALHQWRSARPHWAIVGQVPGTEHFRNVTRHAVVTDPHILMLRVDESLYFANARFLEDRISEAVAGNADLRDVILMCPAVNRIDASALESLKAVNLRLRDAGVRLHLSEVKGPVMDRLHPTEFLSELTGEVFLTQYDAFYALAPERAEATLRAERGVTEAERGDDSGAPARRARA